MSCVQIPLLQEKYPEKALVALDRRNAILFDASATKDLYSPTEEKYDIRVRKPRDAERIPLHAFDDSLELFVYIERDKVFYLPGSARHYPTYATHIPTYTPHDKGSDNPYEIVREMAESALAQSLSDQGDMRDDETRIFWMENLRSLDRFALVHATVIKQKREYRIVAELGPGTFNRYTALFSIGIPIDTE